METTLPTVPRLALSAANITGSDGLAYDQAQITVDAGTAQVVHRTGRHLGTRAAVDRIEVINSRSYRVIFANGDDWMVTRASGCGCR